jgi:hypothetical protein
MINPEASERAFPKPEGRFNDWGERKWIEVPPDRLAAVDAELSKLRLSPRARALYQAARFTDSAGVEFVFVSNAQFPAAVLFEASGIQIVPCFVPFRIAHGAPCEDRQMAMMTRGQFIYDGWVPSNEWTSEKLEQVVSALDDLVNMFSIVGRYYAYWELKYYYQNIPIPSHFILPEDFVSLARTVEAIDQLPPTDKQAVSRSATWIANALRNQSAVQRFLLLFVSIEALASYIEKESLQDSPLREFAADRLSKLEKRQKREACIQAIMDKQPDITIAIQEAYSRCVSGSKKLLEGHLNRVFGRNDVIQAVFGEQEDGKSLYELRNCIAHGTLDMLNAEDVRIISARVGQLEEIAREYLRVILSRVAHVDSFPKPRRPMFTLPASNAIGTLGTQYAGPTDMAEYYGNVEVLVSSYIRVGG